MSGTEIAKEFLITFYHNFCYVYSFILHAWTIFSYRFGADTVSHLYKTKFVLPYWPHIRAGDIGAEDDGG